MAQKRKRRARRTPEPPIRVKPSPEIEARVALEVRRAAEIVGSPAPANLFSSGYLTCAVYYHDGLFNPSLPDRPDGDPADRIITKIVDRMPSGFKREYVAMLRDLCALSASELAPEQFQLPVVYEPIAPYGPVHPSAIDLFADEGAPVVSATRGLVVLAENGWEPQAWFSTSSVRGGNCVIVFDADASRFLRYAHLGLTYPKPGSFVEVGQKIGVVGHTGFNANRPGHGRHLHFEINEFSDRTGLTTVVMHDDLKDLLEATRLSVGVT
jgi:murein DD-endopeptidase MepM/ murein hydrolase activator NlpD